MAAPVDVEIADADIDGLELALVAQFELGGRIDWDGTPAPAGQMHNPRLRLDPLREAENPIAGAIDDAGAFRLVKVSADRYRVSLEGMPDDVFVKSIRLGTREMPDGVLDVGQGAGATLSVILSAAGGQLSGVVRDADGPVLEAAVGLVEDQPRFPPSAWYGRERTAFTFSAGWRRDGTRYSLWTPTTSTRCYRPARWACTRRRRKRSNLRKAIESCATCASDGRGAAGGPAMVWVPDRRDSGLRQWGGLSGRNRDMAAPSHQTRQARTSVRNPLFPLAGAR